VGPTPKIVSSLKLGVALLIDVHDDREPKVLSCGNGEDCTTFIDCPSTRTSWAPTTIMVDDANDLVLVGDSKNLEIHAFDFEGNVVHSIDSPLVMAALAFRPGVFAPLSEVSLTSVSITTTSPITFTATGFKDRFGKPLATDVDFSNFAIKATGDVSSSESNVVLTKTISGDEPQGEEGAVWFAVDVPNAGEWTFSLVDVFGSGYVREERDCEGCLLLLPAAATRRCLTCRCSFC
jgi:hypothetical protein